MPAPGKPRADAWYRQPVLWLGAAVFAASLAGCVWIIVAGARHADTPLDTSHAVFGVPTAARSAPRPSP
jgi:cobalamin synthase